MEQPSLSLGASIFPTLVFSLHAYSDHSCAPHPPPRLLYSLFTLSSAALVKWGHVPLPLSAKVLAHDQVPKGPLRKNAILSNLSGKYLVNHMTSL